jgi:hypothetical protein
MFRKISTIFFMLYAYFLGDNNQVIGQSIRSPSLSSEFQLLTRSRKKLSRRATN